MISDVNGVKEITFGYGSLRVGASAGAEEGVKIASLIFFSADPEPVGTEHPECVGKLDLDNGVDTRVNFPNVESVDMVIECLQAARKFLAGEV